MNRLPKKKKILSLAFLIGWIVLGIMSSLDVMQQITSGPDSKDIGLAWTFCMLGPFTVIQSQKILFESRKMGTLWEGSGKPNFHPIVYNMGGPLFMGWRTLVAFAGGCAMVPVVRFLDYSHDEDGPWCGENGETPKAVFKKWWLGTDGTYFGLFLESPWPFVMAWTCFGFSSFITVNDTVSPDALAIVMLIICIAQGVDAGILILLGQKTVFGARKRGDYTMQNAGAANPYEKVFVYSWGEVFFMMGWILICWGASMP